MKKKGMPAKKLSKSTLITIITAAVIILAISAGGIISIIDRNSPDNSRFGNTPTNISNGGMAAPFADGTAYSNNGIYVKPVEGEAYELTSDRAESLASCGEYLYYCNKSDNDRAYRVGADGVSQKLTDFSVCYINIVNGDIYFLSNKEIDKFGIYKMKADGTELEKISGVYADCLLVYKSRIYYTDRDNNSALCSMSTDGRDMRVIYGDKAVCPVFCENNMRLYFAGRDGIYSCNIDGGALKKMSEAVASRIAIDGETLFYSVFSYSGDQRGGIVRSDISLDSYKRIRPDEVMYLAIADGQLYFKSMTNGFSVMRTDYNGENGVFAAGGEATGLLE